jgi:uncharacterized protein (TIGR02996 family)
MNTDKARDFLDFILAHPDDDAARLVFADWLEENGDGARAEFIRVQVERARLPHWDARQVPLYLRENELIKQHGQRWKAELPDVKGVTWEEFRRGFVATAGFTSFAVLRERASACWAVAPIEAISVRWPRRRESPRMIGPVAGLRELSIQSRFAPLGEVGRLADAPLLSTLRALYIPDGNLGVEGFRQLLASPHLGNLTALRVPGNAIGNGGIGALFDAPSLTHLTELDLSGANGYARYAEDPIIESTGLQSLATWPGLTQLRSLALSRNDVGRDGLRALLRSPRRSALRELTLCANSLDGQAMAEFGDTRTEWQLDVLDLGHNLLEDLGAAYLACAPCLRELKVLALNRCELRPAGARQLAKAPFFSSLRQLNVNQNNFGPDGVEALLKKRPQELHTLQMVDNDLYDEGVLRLAASPASDTLLELDLARNGIGDRAAQTMATSKHLRNLLVLRLNYNPISKSAAASLVQSPLGKRLAVLEGGLTL